MKILAIDTSCDDTSIAISDDLRIIANVFWSKLKAHNDAGGVNPLEAKRQHSEFLAPAVEAALKDAELNMDDIDVVAVTYGPGLAIALEAGIEKAKELSAKHKKPLIAINHMIGHIYANLAQDKHGVSYSGLQEFNFPALALTISGGHTDLYLMTDHLKFDHLAKKLDDAIGEAFDKVGRMLGMGFPAGHKIEQATSKGHTDAYNFPRPMSNTSDLNWSYSGLKTSVLYTIRKIVGDFESKPGKNKYSLQDASALLTEEQINNIAASFQAAAIDALLIKINKALEKYEVRDLIVGGGVIANQTLRASLEKLCAKYGVNLYYPKPMWLCTDNAAMIAAAAYFYAQNNLYVDDVDKLDRIPNLEIAKDL